MQHDDSYKCMNKIIHSDIRRKHNRAVTHLDIFTYSVSYIHWTQRKMSFKFQMTRQVVRLSDSQLESIKSSTTEPSW